MPRNLSDLDPTDSFRLRAGLPADADALSNLALRSKGHWGYSPEFIAACRAELTYAPERMCEPGTSFVVAEAAGTIVGFYVIAIRRGS